MHTIMPSPPRTEPLSSQNVILKQSAFSQRCHQCMKLLILDQLTLARGHDFILALEICLCSETVKSIEVDLWKARKEAN